jgi:hypothetical protein
MGIDRFIPPEHQPSSVRDRIVATACGVGVGIVVALVAWYFTGEAAWFYAVPAGALICAGGIDYRPHVLWWRNDS